MEDIFDVDGAKLLGDRALRVVDVTPREWLVVLIHNAVATVVGSPRRCIGVT
jgi:hypothetical protein